MESKHARQSHAFNEHRLPTHWIRGLEASEKEQLGRRKTCNHILTSLRSGCVPWDKSLPL